MSTNPKLPHFKPFLAYCKTSIGDNAIECETFDDAIKIKRDNDTNSHTPAIIGIYTKIPSCMSISKPEAQYLYEYLHGKPDLSNLLMTLLDEIDYFYPEFKKTVNK